LVVASYHWQSEKEVIKLFNWIRNNKELQFVNINNEVTNLVFYHCVKYLSLCNIWYENEEYLIDIRRLIFVGKYFNQNNIVLNYRSLFDMYRPLLLYLGCWAVMSAGDRMRCLDSRNGSYNPHKCLRFKNLSRLKECINDERKYNGYGKLIKTLFFQCQTMGINGWKSRMNETQFEERMVEYKNILKNVSDIAVLLGFAFNEQLELLTAEIVQQCLKE